MLKLTANSRSGERAELFDCSQTAIIFLARSWPSALRDALWTLPHRLQLRSVEADVTCALTIVVVFHHFAPLVRECSFSAWTPVPTWNTDCCWSWQSQQPKY
jgi:hypothetical protein